MDSARTSPAPTSHSEEKQISAQEIRTAALARAQLRLAEVDYFSATAEVRLSYAREQREKLRRAKGWAPFEPVAEERAATPEPDYKAMLDMPMEEFEKAIGLHQEDEEAQLLTPPASEVSAGEKRKRDESEGEDGSPRKKARKTKEVTGPLRRSQRLKEKAM